MTPNPAPKPKLKIRRRDVKRTFVKAVYVIVALVTVLSMAAPGLI